MKRVMSCLIILVLAVALFAASPGVAWAEEAGPPGGSTGTPATSVEASTEKATPPASAVEAVTIAPLEVEVDYKAMYFAALERVQELEVALQEAVDLARGYRSDWAAERDIAEARRTEADQALKLTEILTGLIRDLKDTVERQHQIIMTLTAPKRSIELIGGAVVHPREPTNPGVLLGIGWHF